MKALLDGDIFLYKIGYTTQEEAEETALLRLSELVSRILDTVKATEYIIYLSCPRNESFRAKLNPEYKAHRKQEKPKHYNALKQELLDKYNAVVAIEEEADDLIGIAQTEDLENTIACTIDKDILYGIEGYKYNFVKEETFYTSKEQATHFFYKQLLMGDKADNIFGLPKVGPVTADKILSGLEGNDEADYFITVYSEYCNRFSEMSKEDLLSLLLLSGQQLKIRTCIGELWQLPNGRRED